jgi:arylsulfatase A-like enzyme
MSCLLANSKEMSTIARMSTPSRAFASTARSQTNRRRRLSATRRAAHVAWIRSWRRLLLLVAVTALFPVLVDAATPPRPNVLFIMTDDHTVQAFGAYGGRFAGLDVTPNLDRLAREGMRLDRVFCGNAICAPSRATILTGQHSQANGVRNLGQPLPPERQALPRLMRAAGYATALLGKWHLTAEPAAYDYYKVLPGQGNYFDPTFHEKGRGAYPDNIVQMKGHSTDAITRLALDWLAARDKTRPFFLSVQFKAPHDPWENAPRYDGFLAETELPLPYNPFGSGGHGSISSRGHRDELMPYLASSLGRRNVLRNTAERLPGFKADPAWSDREHWMAAYNAYLKPYLRCVKGVDDAIGEIHAALQREGLLENTLIVYTSDQGMWLGEHDYMDKRWMYEESMRMPLIVRYPPAIKPGSTSDALVSNIDFAPTLLDYAGAEIPAEMHGRSLRPILETGRAPADWRRAVYYRYWMHLTHNCVPAHFGLRTGRYKLIFFYGIDTDGGGVRTPPGWELYDLAEDPHEMRNVYDEPRHAEVIAELKRELLRLREQYGETDHAHPKVQAVIDAHWHTTPESRAEAIRISHRAKEDFERYGKQAIGSRANRPNSPKN